MCCIPYCSPRHCVVALMYIYWAPWPYSHLPNLTSVFCILASAFREPVTPCLTSHPSRSVTRPVSLIVAATPRLSPDQVFLREGLSFFLYSHTSLQQERRRTSAGETSCTWIPLDVEMEGIRPKDRDRKQILKISYKCSYCLVK